MASGQEEKNRHAQELAKLGASKGGRARASALTPEERRDIARQAAEARWGSQGSAQQGRGEGNAPSQGQEAQAQAKKGHPLPRIKVAIIGVGNCASALVQGTQKYRDVQGGTSIPGLMHTELASYRISDIEFVAAFDIDQNKVGKDLSEAIFTLPNNTIKFAEVPWLGVPVERGMTHDSIGNYVSDLVKKAPGETANIISILRERNVDVVINYLPVGSESATKWYVEQVLQAGCAFVNCMPVFIGRQRDWQQRFRDAGVPIIGDDIKSQVGATITHRVLAHLFRQRGVKLVNSYQLNFGGNTDFLNMLERERLQSKKISKTYAVNSMLEEEMGVENLHIGPSDHVPFLEDRKYCFIKMEGVGFGDIPINLELKLEVWDSPNSAGVVIDAIRCAKVALDRGMSGTLVGPSAYFMKSPPLQFPDDKARELLEGFISGTEEVEAPLTLP